MSDERLQELERRWRVTGAVEDEAAYLSERVRAGRLTPERLQLAAFCGHPASRMTLARFDAAPIAVGWPEDLEVFGEEVCLRVLVELLDAMERTRMTDDQVSVWIETGLAESNEQVHGLLREFLEAMRTYAHGQSHISRQRVTIASESLVTCQINLLNWVWASWDVVTEITAGRDPARAACRAVSLISDQIEQALRPDLLRRHREAVIGWALEDL